MSAAPLVSVITPCLNPGDALTRCIECIRAQTYPAVEHIVIDGGSGDGSIETLEKSEGVKWISEPDTGQSNAMNKGFRMATGELVTWLGADDLLTQRAVELAVEAHVRQGAEWIYGDTRVEKDGEVSVLRGPRRLEKNSFDLGNVVAGVGVFMSASALDRAGCFDESFHLSMDFDLWLKLLDLGVRAAYVPEVLGVYVMHGESKTGSVDRSRFLEEQYRALLSSGRARAADWALGRMAAWDAFSNGVVPEERLFTMISERARVRTGADLASVAAGARVEAALLETPHTLRGIRHLVRREVWRYPQMRRRIRGAVWTAAHRLITERGLRGRGVTK